MEFQFLAAVNKTELQTRVLNDTAQALGVPSTITVSIFGALIKGVVGVVVALFISWQLGMHNHFTHIPISFLFTL